MNTSNKILEFYIGMFKRHPLVLSLTLILYILFTIFFVFREELSLYLTAPNTIKELEVRLFEQQDKIEREKSIVEILTKRTRESSFLKDIKFIEDWKSPEIRDEILRFLDYANFAIKKQDYKHAERLYMEASELQETLTIPYRLGRIYYIQGDLKGAQSQWMNVISLDKENAYPDMRLYVAIILYEKGQIEQSKNFLRHYLGES